MSNEAQLVGALFGPVGLAVGAAIDPSPGFSGGPDTPEEKLSPQASRALVAARKQRLGAASSAMAQSFNTSGGAGSTTSGSAAPSAPKATVLG